MAVNQIDIAEHHKKAIKYFEAVQLFHDFIQKNNVGDHKIIPIGHSVQFDIAFLKKMTGEHNWNRMFSKKVIDTGTIAEFLCTTGVLPKSSKMDCSLPGLAKYFGLSTKGLHDAKFDVELTLEILKELQKLVAI
jgi:DNA polymerase III epsilon subunit-like protein